MQGKFAGMCFVDLLLCGMLIGSVGLIRSTWRTLSWPRPAAPRLPRACERAVVKQGMAGG